MLQGGFDSGRRFGRRFGPFLAKSRSFSRCQARSGPGRVFGRGRFSGERKIFLVRLFFSAGVNLPRVGPARGPSEITPGLRGAPEGAPRARGRSVVARGGDRVRGHRKRGEKLSASPPTRRRKETRAIRKATFDEPQTFFFFFFFSAGVNLPRVGPARGPSEITPGLRGAPSGAPRARDRSVVARGGARGRGHRKSGGGKTLRRFPRRAAAKK